MNDFDLKRKQDGEEFLRLLSSFHSQNPQLRIGQTIVNMLGPLGFSVPPISGDLFYVENDVLLSRLRMFIEFINNYPGRNDGPEDAG